MKRVDNYPVEVHYNWHNSADETGAGEQCSIYKVGDHGVVHISEHLPMGDGDRYYYTVGFEDTHCERVFNINKVIYGKEVVSEMF